jgi:hypothetical protein
MPKAVNTSMNRFQWLLAALLRETAPAVLARGKDAAH